MTATTLKPQAMNSTTRLSSKIKTGTRDLTAATGDVAYTGVGFTPTSIIFNGALGAVATWGMVDSAKTGDGINYKTGVSYFGHVAAGYGANTCLVVDQGSSNFQTASVKSFDADGFTLTWSKVGSPTGTFIFNALCFQ